MKKQNNRNGGDDSRISFFNHLSTKVTILVTGAVVIPLIILITFSTIRTTQTMEETYGTYAQNLAEEAATGIDFATLSSEETYGNYAYNLAGEAAVAINSLKDFGEETYLNYALNLAEGAVVGINASILSCEEIYRNYAQNLAEETVVGIDLVTSLGLTLDSTRIGTILSSIHIKDAASSYAYMVDRNGTTLWHPNPARLGQPVENAAVKGIIADLAAGKKVDNGAILYDYNGAHKLAGYAFTRQGYIVIVTADYDDFVKIDYDSLIGNITISGVDGSYAYMVAPDGTMLWHPTPEKIGQPVENAAVKGIVADLEAGKTVNDGAVVYEYKGSKKIAGYSFTVNGDILLVTADYAAFMKVDYDNLLGGIEISGVEGSYAYMVAPDGTMLWHPNKDKIGQPVENAAVKGIVSDLKAGKKVDDGSVIYEYKGALKVAGYAFTDDGNIVLVTADYDKFVKIDYQALLGDITISNVEGSYAYMVDSDGTMLWHPNADKIGQPVENAAVSGIVERLAKGETVTSDAVVYEYRGSQKLAGYALTKNNVIAVVTADYDKFIAPVKSLRNSMIILTVVAAIICSFAGYIIVLGLKKALDDLVPIIRRTSKFDLTIDNARDRISTRRDEIGLISRAIYDMRAKLAGMVGTIEKASREIDGNVDTLYGSVSRINSLCMDNSATTEELAAEMQETSASVHSITENTDNIQKGAESIRVMANDGNRLSSEIMVRAGELKTTTEKASRETTGLYQAVREKSEAAIEASKAVEKINELTGTIMSISSRTGLLALNASIEAARAGEAGRGFSVVAGEIGNLATQSASAVKDISNIVDEVNVSVRMMSECIEELIRFLETNVLKDYDNFSKVSDQYRNDASSFLSSMSEIDNSISTLSESINMIADAITGINSTIGDSANGVTDVAGKTADMSGETSNATSEVDSCKNSVVELNDIISQFKL